MIELPIDTVLNSDCLWVKDSNGNELSCGFVFTHNESEYLIKFHVKMNQFVAVRRNRSESGLINWRDESWIKNVAKYTTIIGYVYDSSNPELISRWRYYLPENI